MVYENPVGQLDARMETVRWVGRWKFLNGWTKVWKLRPARRRADRERRIVNG